MSKQTSINKKLKNYNRVFLTLIIMSIIILKTIINKHKEKISIDYKIKLKGSLNKKWICFCRLKNNTTNFKF